MSTSLALAILISAFLAVGWMVSWALKSELARLADLAKWEGKYSASARELLANADPLPRSTLATLAFWNEAIADKKFPFLFALALTSKKNKLLNGERASTANDDEERVFLQQNPDFEEKYLETLLSAIMMIGFSHWFWGFYIRATLADILAEHKRRRVERFSKAVQKELGLTKQPLDQAICAASI